MWHCACHQTCTHSVPTSFLTTTGKDIARSSTRAWVESTVACDCVNFGYLCIGALRQRVYAINARAVARVISALVQTVAWRYSRVQLVHIICYCASPESGHQHWTTLNRGHRYCDRTAGANRGYYVNPLSLFARSVIEATSSWQSVDLLELSAWRTRRFAH